MRSIFKGKTYEEIYGLEEAGNQLLKRSQAHKNQIPWNKGKRLDSPKYKKVYEQASIKMKGRVVNPLTRLILSKLNKGKHSSTNTEFKKGNISVWTGTKRPKEFIIKGVLTRKKNNSYYMKDHVKKIHSNLFKQRWAQGKVKIRRGKENPSWAGGISFLPYSPEFNFTFKEEIRMRDNNTCLMCSKASGNNERLSVHHIDYNKLNSTKENCITLCNHCHAKTQFNRTQWMNFFHRTLSDKYNYHYQPIFEFTTT